MAIGHFYGAIKGSLAQQIAGSKSTFGCCDKLQFHVFWPLFGRVAAGLAKFYEHLKRQIKRYRNHINRQRRKKLPAKLSVKPCQWMQLNCLRTHNVTLSLHLEKECVFIL